jgi:hypothetical protein
MYRELLIAVTLACVTIGALLVAGSYGWQGTADMCVAGDQCFCERDRGGLIRTPANTLSNLGFVVAGLGIALTLGIERRQKRYPRPGNPMTETSFYPAFYAGVVTLLGPGSMALHASLMSWGGVLDIVSMNFFIGFALAYAMQRHYGLGRAGFVAVWLGVNAVLLALKLIIGRGSEAFGIVAAAAFLIELQIRRAGQMRGEARWLAAGAGLFLLAFAIWLPSRNGGTLCDPDSLLQGHAAWHLLCAGATVALYFYARSEQSVPKIPAN